MMKKFVLIVAALAAAFYMIFSIAGFGGFDEICKGLSIAALIYGVSRTLAKAVMFGDKGALFTGALGLGILAVGGLYALASLHVMRMEDINLTVEDFSDACSYLFFLAAISLLLTPYVERKKMFLTGMNTLYVVMMLMITYSVVVNNRVLLCVTSMATAFLCIIFSGYLLRLSWIEKELRAARFFACSMISLGILDMIIYPLFLLETSLRLYHIFSALYVPLFIWISEGLLLLSGFATDNVDQKMSCSQPQNHK